MTHFERKHNEMTSVSTQVAAVAGSVRVECGFNTGSDRISQNRTAFREGWDG